MSVDRRSMLAGIGGSCMSLLAGCIEELGESTISQSFSTNYEISRETIVAISNRYGDVTVRGTNDDRLTIVGEKHAGSQAGLDSISVDVITGERFVIDVRFGAGSSGTDRRIDLTVDIPAGVRVDRALTANGNVTVSNVRGDLHAATSNGDIEVTDVSGFVRCEAANGDIRTRETTGLAGVRTSNGDIDVELLRMREDVTCHSSSGDVTVGVGPDISAAIRLSTSNGIAEVRDLPHAVTTERNGYIVGSLRGGRSPLLFLGSSNGDVILRPI